MGTPFQGVEMRIICLCGFSLVALGLAGCDAFTRPPPRPAYYVAPPAPGQRRCVEFREDIFGRRYCSAFVGS